MSETGLLDYFGRDLTDATREDKPDAATGREREIERVIQVLTRPRNRKCNLLLVGPPGAARTVIIEGLVRAIADGAAPEALAGMRIYALDLGALVRDGDGADRRFTQVLHEMRDRGDVIPFVDRLHLFAGRYVPGRTLIDLTSLLVPVLARGQLRMIGAMTLQEYRDYVEKDAALEVRFQGVRIDLP